MSFYTIGSTNALSELGFVDVEKHEHKKIARNADPHELIGDAAIYTLPTIGAQAALAPFALAGASAESRLNKPFTLADEEALRKAMKIDPAVSVFRDQESHLSSHYNPTTKEVRVARKPSPYVLSHEFGHATGKRLLPLIAADKLLRVGKLGLLTSTAFTDPEGTLSKATPYLIGAAGLPLLAEEARASYKGLKGLKTIGRGKGAWRTLLPALGTYAAGTTLPAVAAEIIRRRRVDRDKELF